MWQAPTEMSLHITHYSLQAAIQTRFDEKQASVNAGKFLVCQTP